MGTQTIRISEHDHMVLSTLSQKSGRAMSSLLSEAIQDMAGKQLLADTNAAYARLHANVHAWDEETRERMLWDGTPGHEPR